MKKFLMIVAMCCLTMATAQAQEVFKELLKSAKEIAEDKSKDIETVTMLNEQSFAMHEFVTLYLNSLAKAKKKSERDIIITVFRDASINNPLFNDMDKELILAYYNNENYLTQFSLDTNWVKALEAVRKE